MRRELFTIIFSLLIVLGLGIRANIETQLQAQASKIIELRGEVAEGVREIGDLQEQLRPLEYSQPLDQIRVSSETGIRTDPLGGGEERLHEGDDLKGDIGDPVYTVLDGRVVENWMPPGFYDGEWFSGHKTFGGYIVIDHGDQVFSKYGHLSKTIIRETQWVKAGEKIGELGNTGISTGPHLHFSIVTNPFKYLRERR